MHARLRLPSNGHPAKPKHSASTNKAQLLHCVTPALSASAAAPGNSQEFAIAHSNVLACDLDTLVPTIFAQNCFGLFDGAAP